MSRLILSILVGTLLASCIQTSDPEYAKRINYLFHVESVGDTLSSSDNTLHVSEFKLLAEKFNVRFNDEGILQSSVDGLVMQYSQSNDDDELVLGVEIGYEDITQFYGLDLFIAPPAEGDNIRDNDFFGSDNNYSLVIRGSYNETDFTYRSNPVFEKNFEFERVELSDSEPTLVLRVLLDAEEVLTTEDGNLLNPNEQSDATVIDSLVQQSLNLEAFATNNPFER